MPASLKLPNWATQSTSSAMEKSLLQMQAPDFISFALGCPDTALLPNALYQESIHEVLKQGHGIFQYQPPKEELKTHIVQLMKLRGVICNTKQILLTAGAQQGISLLMRLLMENGNAVILEELAYPGALQALEPYNADILSVPTDPNTGMDVDAVEYLLKQQSPKFIYLVSDGSNPHTASLTAEKRRHLAKLSEQYAVPIIEDDPYGFIQYSTPIAPIKHYQPDWVFYVGSFSKILSPSFRVGWLVVPEWLIPKLASLKECSDINTMTFTQHIVLHLLNKHFFTGHIDLVNKEYKKRRDCMAQALQAQLGKEINFHLPTAGIFMWINFLRNIDTTELLEKAIYQEKVAFIPSHAFKSSSDSRATNGIRLNFSALSKETIQLGIVRLAQLYKHTINNNPKEEYLYV